MRRAILPRLMRFALAVVIAATATGAARQMVQACPALVATSIHSAIPDPQWSDLFHPSASASNVSGRIHAVKGPIEQARRLAAWAALVLAGGWLLALREFVRALMPWRKAENISPGVKGRTGFEQ